MFRWYIKYSSFDRGFTFFSIITSRPASLRNPLIQNESAIKPKVLPYIYIYQMIGIPVIACQYSIKLGLNTHLNITVHVVVYKSTRFPYCYVFDWNKIVNYLSVCLHVFSGNWTYHIHLNSASVGGTSCLIPEISIVTFIYFEKHNLNSYIASIWSMFSFKCIYSSRRFQRTLRFVASFYIDKAIAKINLVRSFRV